MIITTDGGITWSEANIHSEFFQPVGIPNSTTFFAISEACIPDPSKAGIVVRSDDGGVTWKELYKYPTFGNDLVTGMMQAGKNMSLFFQTTTDGSEGVMMSLDSGKTFTSICGPVNFEDTRFYVRDTFIYAGDKYGGLWLNTTGIGSNSTPQLSKNTISLSSEFCNVIEDTLIFTLFDSCNGRNAELLEASVSGSNRFSLVGGAVPRTIIPNDTLRIIYTPDPNSALDESATLRMKLKLGWKVFDTVITITGKNISPHLDITLTPTLTANNITAGSTAECAVYSSEQVEKRGLNSVTLDILYDNDLLEASDITAQNGITASFTTAIVTNGTARLPVTLTGSDMTIDKNAPLVTVKFKTILTDTTISTIELSNVKLNNDDQDYKNCTLSATGNNTTFTQASICGDSTLRSFMVTSKLIDILSIRPNPATDELRVEFRMPAGEDAVISIIDVSGAVVFAKHVVSKGGEYTIDTSSLPSGSYTLSIRSNGESASSRFIITK